jgi:hypothetical protein
VQAQRAAAEARVAQSESEGRRVGRMTRGEIHDLVRALDGLLSVLCVADPVDKLEVYRQLGLHLAHDHKTQTVPTES